MLISRQRHERDKAEAIAKASRVNEEILGGLPQAIFLLDRDLRIRAPISRLTESLFRRRDFLNTPFEKLLESILPPKSQAPAQEFLARLRSADAPADLNGASPLQEIAVRIASGDGTVENKHLSFTFRRIITFTDGQSWVVTVTDVSQKVESARELEELRAYSKTQAACLASLVRVGAERFTGFLRRSDAAVSMIHAVLKKPARTSHAFRLKLDEILHEISQIKQQAGVLELETVERLAQIFQDAAADLTRKESLSGSDFLPLAVRLDELFAQLALMRSMTSVTPAHRVAPARPAAPIVEPGKPRTTDNGTEIIEPSKLAALTAAAAAAAAGLPPPVPVARPIPAGSLESALQSIAEHVTQSLACAVTLSCEGLSEVPTAYQGVVKNIAIQLIRNAVMHGIEPAPERIVAGKPAAGQMWLRFQALPGQGYQLTFEDDGRGLDAALLRDTALAKGLITTEAAEQISDRQAIKLIFRKGFSTVAQPTAEAGRGMGMALVRRYVTEAGGRVALASKPGVQTRFRVILPPVPQAASHTQVA